MAEERNLRQIAARMAERYGVDPQLYVRLIERESGFDPNARGAAGELGLSQIMATTARDPGYGVRPIDDRLDPVENLRFGAEYLGALVRHYDGDYERALQAYNGGSGNVNAGTTSDAARRYAQELLSGVSISTKGGDGAVVSAENVPMDDAQIGDINRLIEELFPEQPQLRAPSAPGLDRTDRTGQMSPLSRMPVPGLQAIDTYSTPAIQAVRNPSMGGIAGLASRAR